MVSSVVDPLVALLLTSGLLWVVVGLIVGCEWRDGRLLVIDDLALGAGLFLGGALLLVGVIVIV